MRYAEPANRATTVTAKSAPFPVTLDDAKLFLRKMGNELDAEIDAALSAAVAWAEKISGRALRVSHTMTDTFRSWPLSACLYFDRQPVKSITSVKYYDTSDVQQTVSSADYRLRTSTDGASWLEFVSDYSYPATEDRGDAIEVIYVVGYATIDDVPDEAKRAILFQTAINFGELNERELLAYERARNDNLSAAGWGWYR